jgi:hypothetical protein
MHPWNLAFLDIGNEILESFLEHYEDWQQVPKSFQYCHIPTIEQDTPIFFK